MRFLIFLLLFGFSSVYCKNYVKTLTESMGQEVIEIGPVVKELPPGLDEEPSAEFEDETTISATKRETKKTTALASTAITQKASELRSAGQDDDERRIEKELSEVYKDTDYKAESSQHSTTDGTAETVPALRQRGRANFKFQPDVNDRADVERFRTSVDDISCEKRATQRLQEDTSASKTRPLSNSTAMSLAFLSILFVLQ